jgi:putative MATE family efflux protein
VLAVGSVSLVAQAVGRKDQADANLVFNQSLMLSVGCGVAVITLIYATIRHYLESIAADQATIEAGVTFMFWALPGFGLMFLMSALAAALRGTGIVRPTIAVQMLTVVINIILAPILIAGWGTGVPLGVKGAALASTISIAIGVLLLGIYFYRMEHYVSIQLALMRPRFKQWLRVLHIGLPSGGEMLLMFIFTAVVYYTLRNFGASAQAGFGIGSRVLQAILMPALAISMATGPMIGQNYGAGNAARVKATFRSAAMIGTIVMVVATIIAQVSPHSIMSIFNADPEATAIATLFLKMISLNFVAQGIAFTCSATFQGMGNTLPSLLSSGVRLFSFAIPSIWLSHQPGFKIEHVWYVSIAASTLQAVVSWSLLQRQFKRQLPLLSAKQVAHA